MLTKRRINHKSSVRAAVWDACGGKCHHCEKALDPFRDFHLDHLIPLSRGGPDTLENLVGSCATCNLRRGDRMTTMKPAFASIPRGPLNGSLVVAYRQHLGMTQEELAGRLDVVTPIVDEWESMAGAVPDERMLELALLRLMDERRQLAEEMLSRPLRDDVAPATRPGRPAKGARDG